MKKYSKNEIAQMIDHTCLKADAIYEDMKKLCEEAVHHHFKMVAINQSQTAVCHALLKGSGVHVGAAIGFPLGQTTVEVKVFETQDAIDHGADEIDYVINIGALKDKNYELIESEMSQIVTLCHKNDVICKVIFENCLLTPEEIKKMSEIAKKVKPDFIKTSTGMSNYGARLEDVKIMKAVVQDEVAIKAAGGIRDVETLQAMLDLGVSRIGTSSGINLLKLWKQA